MLGCSVTYRPTGVEERLFAVEDGTMLRSFLQDIHWNGLDDVNWRHSASLEQILPRFLPKAYTSPRHTATIDHVISSAAGGTARLIQGSTDHFLSVAA